MSNNWKNWAKLLVLALVMTANVQLSAQTPTDNSPYSRYGLGNLISSNFGAVTGMGGISTAYNNYGSVNLTNPASLGFLYTTSFETGLQSELNWLSTPDGTSDFTADGNLSHFVLGFPLKNPLNRLTELKRSSFNWGTAFGVLPYSKVAYDIETESILPNIDTVISRTRGTGGLYQVMLSNGASYEGYAVGVSLGYLFGNTNEDRTTIFSDIPNSFTNVFVDETNYSGFVYKFGVQKEFIFNKVDEKDKTAIKANRKQTKLTLGVTGNNTMSLSTETSSLDRRYNVSYGFDTILVTNEVLGNTILPSAYSFGITLAQDNHWLVGLDYSIARWGEYSNPSKSDSLANSFRVGFGAQYTPDISAFNNYAKRMTYRIGGFYELDPRVIQGEQLTSYGMTMGVGLPITLPKKGTVGYSNIGVELGRLGIGSPIGETYMRITAAFTLNDNTWFYKRKFD
jgi:hypothetical protein